MTISYMYILYNYIYDYSIYMNIYTHQLVKHKSHLSLDSSER